MVNRLFVKNLFAQTLGFKLDKADLCFQELDGYVCCFEEGIRAINKANKKKNRIKTSLKIIILKIFH